MVSNRSSPQTSMVNRWSEKNSYLMAQDIEQPKYGLRELYRPETGPIQVEYDFPACPLKNSTCADLSYSITAVHGLNGGALSTWTANNGKCWLQDNEFLPKYITQSRVLTWGYNATVVGKAQA